MQRANVTDFSASLILFDSRLRSFIHIYITTVNLSTSKLCREKKFQQLIREEVHFINTTFHTTIPKFIHRAISLRISAAVF